MATKLPGPKATVTVGLALVIALSVYLIWTMVAYVRGGNEKFEGVYAPAEFFEDMEEYPFRGANETYAELTELEPYDQLEDVDETFAPLDSETKMSKWGDGSIIGTGAPMPTFSPLLIETAHVSDDANALFSI
jgi:hypothetical protein